MPTQHGIMGLDKSLLSQIERMPVLPVGPTGSTYSTTACPWAGSTSEVALYLRVGPGLGLGLGLGRGDGLAWIVEGTSKDSTVQCWQTRLRQGCSTFGDDGQSGLPAHSFSPTGTTEPNLDSLTGQSQTTRLAAELATLRLQLQPACVQAL